MKEGEENGENTQNKTATDAEDGGSGGDSIEVQKQADRGGSKRTADRQITKDDDDEDSNSDGNQKLQQGFERASAETLKKRRILKVTRPAAGSAANIASTSSKSKADCKEDKGLVKENGEAKSDKNDEKDNAVKDSTTIDTSTSKKEGEGDKGNSSSTTSSTNPFANISMTGSAKTKQSSSAGFGKFAATNPFKSAATGATTSIFGSSAKFGSVGSSGFANTTSSNNQSTKTASSSAPTSVFGQGTALLSGFGIKSSATEGGSSGADASSGKESSTTTSAFGFTSTTATEKTTDNGGSGFTFGFAAAAAAAAAAKTPTEDNSASAGGASSVFPSAPADAADPANGEENEVCLLQLRAKLYRMEHHDEKTSDAADEQEGEENSKKDNESSKDDSATTTNDNDDKKRQKQQQQAKSDWKEVGIGPVRILQEQQQKKKDEDSASTSTGTKIRIVQRRETTPGGPGTKLILNVPIRQETDVHRHADKFVRLTTVTVEKEPATYLFKVKSMDDADSLVEKLEEAISCIKETSES